MDVLVPEAVVSLLMDIHQISPEEVCPHLWLYLFLIVISLCIWHDPFLYITPG